MIAREFGPALTLACILGTALSACGSQEPLPEATGKASIPPELCQELEGVLTDLQKKTGFQLEPQGATIEEAVWRGMGGAQDQLAEALAYHQACKAETPPAEQSVTIRNEYGRVVAERQVSIASGAGLAEGG